MSARSGMRALEEVRIGALRAVVREGAMHRELVFFQGGREQSQTRVALRSLRSGWPCVDGFHFAPVIAGQMRRALFVGCGGGLAPRQFHRAYPEAEIDVVDISCEVVALARRWFGLSPDGRLRIHIADGRAFLRHQAIASYDVVVSDVWAAGEIPRSFASEEYWVEVRRVLRQGGCLAANLAGVLSEAGDPVHRITAGAARAFGAASIRLVAVPDPGELPSELRLDLRRNAVLIARAGEALPSSASLRDLTRMMDFPWLVHLSRMADASEVTPVERALPFSDTDAGGAIRVF